MAFTADEQDRLMVLRHHFPNAHVRQMVDLIQQNALYIFTNDWSTINQIKPHLKVTCFQLKVWEALLKIPTGQLSTYGGIAAKINNPYASRAAGTAIGSNPVAF
jgi:AraC family transcriptional regulator of adaptative response/methylated-DNA-[protein]-cysteine methyltransferase